MKNVKQEQHINELIAQLTLEEKIGMIHGAGLFRTDGVERLGIPPLYMSDGPMGVRQEFANDEWRTTGTTDDFVSYLPSNSAIASTWNRTLAHTAGSVLGEEARGRGKDVILAPGINIKRSPLCGRNFEYMSEDPRVIEEMAVPMVQGIQENDVSACVKHFAANSQETQRLSVDTVVDERTLNEIYFPGFKAVVEKGGAHSLMGAYNKLNGEHCCTSKSLLNQVLRKEWGFDGMVVSDWGGVHDTALAAESALDIEMDVIYQFDKHYMADALLDKIKSGEISEELVDEKIRNILRLMMRLNMIGENKGKRKAGSYNTQSHRDAALEVARESVILLKNEGNILPFAIPQNDVPKHTIAVIGANAAAQHSNGGGSAEIKALYEITPLMGIKKLLGGNADISYAQGYFIPKDEENCEINWQALSTAQGAEPEQENTVQDLELKQREYMDEALELARKSETVIFVGGLNHNYDVEGKDRQDMALPYAQDALIEELLKINPNTVIVLYGGSPVKMPWADRAKSIVWCYYAGMEGGSAIAEVLFGKVNPSGKLAETFICSKEQCPAHTIGEFGKTDSVEYKEGIMVGYRYYDSQNIPVLFPFGHGISYSNFEYSGLEASWDEKSMRCEISLNVKNTGSMDGKETVQIYAAPLSPSVPRPTHELKAFNKVFLKAGEEKSLKFILTERDFSYYDTAHKRFAVDFCEYEIQAAASSRDIRLCKKISIFE